MILDDSISFLKKAPPFQFLDDATLKSVAGSLSMEFYPKDTVILKQDGLPSDSLRIIKKGSVKILMRAETGEDMAMDYRGEGENFGFLSMIGKEKGKTTVVALDDTVCYLLRKEKVMELLASNPAFNEYYMSYLSRYVDRTYREMQNKSMFYGSSDRFLFTTPVGNITAEAVTVGEDTTIQEAAQVMSRKKISSLIVLDRRNLPAGIVTDNDLRDKVVAKGRNVSEPVRNIMTISLIRVDASDSCFEAVLKMIKYHIHHMLVIEDGTLKGIMTNHDLMLLQGTSPLSFANDIENQQSVDGLIQVSGKINNIVGILLKEGAKASNITKIITEINDRLIRKIIEIGEKTFGHPPVPYCWIALGSEGRREQTFKTDQDNAIIYADPSSDAEEEEVKKYFLGFTPFVRESLTRIGFPLCTADYMASNPRWCQPLRSWKKYFLNWISEPTPDAVLKSLIFFDFRPLHGKFGLADELRDSFRSRIEDQGIFLGHMANMIIRNTPPIGFLKSFVVEKGGEHKDEFDLKIKGIAPLVDAVRLFALEKGVKETSTSGRIQLLKDKNTIVKDSADGLEQALEFIMLLRIHHQFEQIKSGLKPDNFINPNTLSTLEKKTLKEAFHVISSLQGMIFERYKPFIK
jgi:CBS domain-containing protein